MISPTLRCRRTTHGAQDGWRGRQKGRRRREEDAVVKKEEKEKVNGRRR